MIGSIDGTTATSTAARKQSQHPQHPHPQLPQPQLPQPQPQNKQYPDLSRRKGLVSAKQQSTDESYPTTKAKSATAMAASTNKHTINQPPLDLSTMTDPFPQPPEGVSILQTGRPSLIFESMLHTFSCMELMCVEGVCVSIVFDGSHAIDE